MGREEQRSKVKIHQLFRPGWMITSVGSPATSWSCSRATTSSLPSPCRRWVKGEARDSEVKEASRQEEKVTEESKQEAGAIGAWVQELLRQGGGQELQEQEGKRCRSYRRKEEGGAGVTWE